MSDEPIDTDTTDQQRPQMQHKQLTCMSRYVCLSVCLSVCVYMCACAL